MVLDVQLFRDYAAEGNPNLIRESQRRRCKDPALVDKVIEVDAELRAALVKAETLKKVAGFCSALFGAKKKAKEPEGEDLPIPDDLRSRIVELKKDDLAGLNATQLKTFSKEIGKMAAEETEKQAEIEKRRDEAVKAVGNIVHESLKASTDEDENEVVRTWGELPKKTESTWNHVDLMLLLGGMDTTRAATDTAGSRSYFLKGELVQLQLALINYAMSFLAGKDYTPFYPPYFMRKEQMAKVAELASFDEELYHVGGDGEDDKYLIATSEQPLCAYHAGKWFTEAELKKGEPLKYAGYSTCFRKEAGSHGRDTLGIFRVHQFEKIEQFIVCQPRDGESWELLEEMISTSEEFYKSLGLPYRVVSIVAGAVNLAAAKKYDLEAYFPASETFRELVSVSNCTDYQSRAINCRYGASLKGTGREGKKEFVHMLNGTLCAITRTMCCLVENHQTEEGINIPEPLQMYMGGKKFMKFAGPKVRKPEEKKKGGKKE